MGFGLFNEAFLLFPEVFWDTSKDYIGLTSRTRGKYYLFINMFKCTGKPALVVYIAGEIAYELERWTDDAIIHDIMGYLKKVTVVCHHCFVLRHNSNFWFLQIFGENIPMPIKTLVTRWHSDPYARGSHSFIQAGAKSSDYDILARPIQDRHVLILPSLNSLKKLVNINILALCECRLLFAGEHTCRKHPATVAGAYISGLREAKRIARLVSDGTQR